MRLCSSHGRRRVEVSEWREDVLLLTEQEVNSGVADKHRFGALDDQLKEAKYPSIPRGLVWPKQENYWLGLSKEGV